MQDGLLGQASDTDSEADDMNIRVGDEVHYHVREETEAKQPETVSVEASQPSSQQTTPSLVRKALPYILAAALGGGGVGAGLLPWLLSKPAKPPAASDTDTTRRIEIEKWILEE